MGHFCFGGGTFPRHIDNYSIIKIRIKMDLGANRLDHWIAFLHAAVMASVV